jgi:hypothetical protein
MFCGIYQVGTDGESQESSGNTTEEVNAALVSVFVVTCAVCTFFFGFSCVELWGGVVAVN